MYTLLPKVLFVSDELVPVGLVDDSFPYERRQEDMETPRPAIDENEDVVAVNLVEATFLFVKPKVIGFVKLNRMMANMQMDATFLIIVDFATTGRIMV